jgi:predicted RNase H-like HicB family nuclease
MRIQGRPGRLNLLCIRATIWLGDQVMKIKIVVHEAEEGGFWAEVPAIPGCATQGDSMDELMQNLHEAIEGCLSIEVAPPEPGGVERMLELPA